MTKPADQPGARTAPSGTGNAVETVSLERRDEAPRQSLFGAPAAPPLARAAQLSLQLILVAAGLTLIGFLVVQLRLVVLPVLAALFLAPLLVPVAEFLKRRRLPDALAALISLVGGIALLAGIVTLLAPAVGNELDTLGESFRAGLEEVASLLGTFGISEEEIDQAIDDALAALGENSGGIGQRVVTGALLVGEVLTGLLLAVVLLFFMLKDGERIWGWAVSLMPARRRPATREVGRRSWTTLGAYLRGVSLVALFDATLIAIALAILGVPLVLPLAVLTFFGAFFPLVGAVAAGFVAALVALVSNGVVTALIVVGVITLIQQLEGDVVYPFVVGRSIQLHPIAILLVLTAGAVVAGVVGALFAVPLAAIAWTAIQYLRGADEDGGESGEAAPAG